MKSLVIASALVATLVVPLQSQTSSWTLTSERDFGTHCFVGSFKACASVQVSTYFDPTAFGGEGGTQMRFRLSNPQGLPGFEGRPVGFKAVKVTDVSGRRTYPNFSGWAFRAQHEGIEGNAVNAYNSMDTWDQGPDGVGIAYEVDAFLYGCDRPGNYTPWYGYDTTCGGAITISLDIATDDVRVTKNSELDLVFVTFSESTGQWNGGGMCRTGADCVMVTPEPVTLVLVGSGLSVVGLMSRRRRREDL